MTQQSAGGAGDSPPHSQHRHRPHPPTGSNLLLSSSIMVTPWPQASYLQKINGRGRSHVRLRGGTALPAVELVAGLVRRGESQQPQDAAHTSAGGNGSRSNQTDLPLCLPVFALAAELLHLVCLPGL